MRHRIAIATILAACALRASAYQIPSFTVDAGGGASSGGAWSLTGTIGQPDAGVLSNGVYTLHGGFWWGGVAPTAVEEQPRLAGARFSLQPVQPNPSNPATSIRFELASAGQVSVRIYNLRGELVTTLLDAQRPAGQHQLVWRGQDDRGLPVASGVYVVRVDSGGENASRRIVLVR
jgi:hypothetical protein